MEVDELYQNAGSKGTPSHPPADPPRRRANKARGHGTWENDRPPVVGLVGRDTGTLVLEVAQHSDRATLQPFVEQHTRPDATIYTDEWRAYARVSDTGRRHATVCHTPGQREWARDDDGDGINEVHVNTLEGIWTGVRNFLRPFRGISKVYLAQYLAVFAWTYHLVHVTTEFVRAMMVPITLEPS